VRQSKDRVRVYLCATNKVVVRYAFADGCEAMTVLAVSLLQSLRPGLRFVP
jgi:hypothetical protein